MSTKNKFATIAWLFILSEYLIGGEGLIKYLQTNGSFSRDFGILQAYNVLFGYGVSSSQIVAGGLSSVVFDLLSLVALMIIGSYLGLRYIKKKIKINSENFNYLSAGLTLTYIVLQVIFLILWIFLESPSSNILLRQIIVWLGYDTAVYITFRYFILKKMSA